MRDPLKDLEALEKLIASALQGNGLTLEEHTLRVQPNGLVTFRAALVSMSKPTDTSSGQMVAPLQTQEEYDALFQRMIEDL
ncbi:hypothetical protein EKI60_05850 [Candidatus Saccharibacteria bacterium]|nr:MAG: hypothetical protein EKI60_05850 [Candidatus Saccharibacteria bacterium]